ncbi:HNH endonuclease family protein, partial [Streptomyces sp. NPDC056728]
ELTAELAGKADQSERERWLLLLRDVVLDHVSTVTVTCSSEQDAASIFETLNDRGLGLSTVDLLRNFVLRRAGEPEREEIVNLWGEILEQSKIVDVDEFLRHYWTSRHGDIKSQRLYRAIRENLESTNGSSLTFMRDLASAHASYVRLLRPDFEDSRTNEALHDISDLKAKMLYPLLLSGLNHANVDFAALARGATVFYVREGIVAKQNGSRTEKLIYAAAAELNDDGDADDALAKLHEGSVPQGVFDAAVKELRGLDTASARYLLREIEISYRNGDETDVARQPRIHVEHIYPQKPRAGERWDNHSEYVNKLGNLTILSRRINTSIKNSPFSIKRAELAKSELFITKKVAQQPEWNQSKIDERQLELGAEIQRIWAWPAEVLEAVGAWREKNKNSPGATINP